MSRTKTNQAAQIWPAGCNVQGHGLGHRHWSLIVGLKSSPPPLTSIETLGQVIYFSEFQFSYLENGDNKCTYPMRWLGNSVKYCVMPLNSVWSRVWDMCYYLYE